MRKVSPDTRARLDPRANPARRGLREPKGIGVIRAYRVRLGQRVTREIAAHKELRESQPLPDRLLKKAHLLRWPARALAAAYLEYASLGPSRAALHPDLFEQPGRKRDLQQLAWKTRELPLKGCPVPFLRLEMRRAPSKRPPPSFH